MNHCSVHFKDFIFLCSTCSKLVCKQCCVSDHNQHRFDDFDSIKEQVLKTNGYQDKISNLFDRLKTIKSTIDSLESTLDEITKFYEDIHNVLMVEEHKKKKPVEEQLELAKSLIPLVIEEINSLKVITNTIYNNENPENSESSEGRSGEHVSESPDSSNTKEHQQYNAIGDLLKAVEQSVDHKQLFQTFQNVFSEVSFANPADKIDFLSHVSKHKDMKKTNSQIIPSKYVAMFDHNQIKIIKDGFDTMWQLEKSRDNDMIVYYNGVETKFFDMKTQTITKPNSLKDVKPAHMVQVGDDIFFFDSEYIKYSISKKTITKFPRSTQIKSTMESACYDKEKNQIYILHRYTSRSRDYYSIGREIEIVDPNILSTQFISISITSISEILANNGVVYLVDSSNIYTLSDTYKITSNVDFSKNFSMKHCAIGDNHIYIFTNFNTIERYDLGSKSFTTVPHMNQLVTNAQSNPISKIVFIPSSGISSSKLYCFSNSSKNAKVYDLVTFMYTDIVIEPLTDAIYIKRH
ncbi:hypothetical protein PPL_03591 [Heterostelium album PN500]|uniref:B box-type domain-containing protein n=1 Tax=Heterostelium pallidum (strain ATCC 26659 / Pp 5 / PN500) TaxID=670386 RepID=D3B578_HETP5|nr:hypothetical protein PPL_03591 [Heterostelium album PN500]EFA83443.1 hypothetical protein PPL_03591 [Heterostelium album PN500]|eukprot:XP_020435560.1 hypothetical protein PPL_03591 [Heterostelium album PN500]